MSDHATRWLKAQRYVADGNTAAAAATLEALVAAAPGAVEAWLLLSSVHLARGQLQAACADVLAAAAHLPADATAEGVANVAWCLQRLGETVALRDCLAHPAIGRCRDPATLMRLAQLERLLGRQHAALALMERAAEAGPLTSGHRYQRALQLEFTGALAAAGRELAGCAAATDGDPRAVLALVRLGHPVSAEASLALIDRWLPRVAVGSEGEAALAFARFHVLDRHGRHGEAWAALARGNAIMHARVPFDAALERRHFAALIGMGGNARTGVAPAADGPTPVFIVGLPRSGTTLLERMLGNHSSIAACGELADFPRQLRHVADAWGKALVDDPLLARLPALEHADVGHRYLAQTRWRAGDKPYYTDKLPGNFLFIGSIRRALPRARIVHLARDAAGTCFSNWKALYGDAHGYSYDLAALAQYYRGYRDLMAHWHAAFPDQVLDVAYADLVTDPARAIARVLAFLGLPFESACLDVTANAAPVATLSTAQVREPVHTRALDAWRPYRDALAPLLLAIGVA